MEHAPSVRRPGAGLMPFYAQLVQQLARDGVRGADGTTAPFTEAQAFVMNHAIAGVLRALAANKSYPPPAQEVKDALGAAGARLRGTAGTSGRAGGVSTRWVRTVWMAGCGRRAAPMISSSLESGPWSVTLPGRLLTADFWNCWIQTGRSVDELEPQQSGVDFVHRSTRHRPTTDTQGQSPERTLAGQN